MKVIAIKDFAGASINREELGNVEEGRTVEVSENDAQFLEREGYAERVDDEPAEDAPAPASAGESSDAAAKVPPTD